MKFPRKVWWFQRRNGRRGDAVDHVRAGQTLSNGSPVSLILKGRCALPQPDAVLRPGDTIRERRANGDGGRSAIRAMVDSAVLRLSRDTLRRLSDRWSVGALATHRRPGPGIVRRVDEETHGGKIVCLMPLSEGLPCADFARSLAATIAEETSQSVLCLQVEGADVAKNGSPAAVPGHAGVFRQLVGGGGRDDRWVENLARKKGVLLQSLIHQRTNSAHPLTLMPSES